MIEVVFLYLIILNIIGLFVMYLDKYKAKHRQYRISESKLWLVAFFGGALGSTLGMHLFRHKTKHINFKLGFPILAILHIAIVFFLFLG
ncbi:DUF1294 domain-containing protein [Terrilactibacillus sp. BCM23-1]|uniref:DUF1294 domain-containing protein n=1 Tax=Terrilactibacillus tamarindi TaxID=2599694 RepID=A0A6N8CLD7_9BACI|nr:DUF1294 domain-containing protein [Terrilactibacillus tamarindi]